MAAISNIMDLSYMFMIVLITSVISTPRAPYLDFFSGLGSEPFSGQQRNPASKGISESSTPRPSQDVSSTLFPFELPTYSPDSVKARPAFRVQEPATEAPSATDAAGKGQFNLMDINTWDTIPAAFFEPSMPAVSRGASKGETAGHGTSGRSSPLSYSEAGAEPSLAWDYSSVGMGGGTDAGAGGTQDVFLPLADHSPSSTNADQPEMMSDWSLPPVSKDTAKYREEPVKKPTKRFNDGESMARAILSGQVKKWEWTYSTTLGGGRLSSGYDDRNDKSMTCCQRLPYICGVDGMCVIDIDECRDFCTCAANPQMPHCISVIPVIKRTMAALEKKILAKLAKELNMTTPSPMNTHGSRPAAPSVVDPTIIEARNPPTSLGENFASMTRATRKPIATIIKTATARRPAASIYQPSSLHQTAMSTFASAPYASIRQSETLLSQNPNSHNPFSQHSKPTPITFGTSGMTIGQNRQGTVTSTNTQKAVATSATPAPSSTKSFVNFPRAIIKTAPSLLTNFNNNDLTATSATIPTLAPKTSIHNPRKQTTSEQMKPSPIISKVSFIVDHDAIHQTTNTLLPSSVKSSNFTSTNSRQSQYLIKPEINYPTLSTTVTNTASGGAAVTRGNNINNHEMSATSSNINDTNVRSDISTATRKTNNLPSVGSTNIGSTLHYVKETRTAQSDKAAIGHTNTSNTNSASVSAVMTNGISISKPTLNETSGNIHDTDARSNISKKATKANASGSIGTLTTGRSIPEHMNETRTVQSNKAVNGHTQTSNTNNSSSSAVMTNGISISKPTMNATSGNIHDTDARSNISKKATKANAPESIGNLTTGRSIHEHMNETRTVQSNKAVNGHTQTSNTNNSSSSAVVTNGISISKPTMNATSGNIHDTDARSNISKKATKANAPGSIGTLTTGRSIHEHMNETRTVQSNKAVNGHTKTSNTNNSSSSAVMTNGISISKPTMNATSGNIHDTDARSNISKKATKANAPGSIGTLTTGRSIHEHMNETRTDQSNKATIGHTKTSNTNNSSSSTVKTNGMNINKQLYATSRTTLATTFSAGSSIGTAETNTNLKSSTVRPTTGVDKHTDKSSNNTGINKIIITTTGTTMSTKRSDSVNNVPSTSTSRHTDDSAKSVTSDGLLSNAATSPTKHLSPTLETTEVTSSIITKTPAPNILPSLPTQIVGKGVINVPLSSSYANPSLSTTYGSTRKSSSNTSSSSVKTTTVSVDANFHLEQSTTSLPDRAVELPHSAQPSSSTDENPKTTSGINAKTYSTFSKVAAENTTEVTNSTLTTSTAMSSSVNDYNTTKIYNPSTLNVTSSRTSNVTPATTEIPPSRTMETSELLQVTRQSSAENTSTMVTGDVENLTRETYPLENNFTAASAYIQTMNESVSGSRNGSNLTLVKNTSLAPGNSEGYDASENDILQYEAGMLTTSPQNEMLMPCSNDCQEKGGVCVVGIGFKSHCVVVTDTCDELLCIHGYCVSTDRLHSCECHRGWAGAFCEKRCDLDCGEHSFCGAVSENENVSCTCRWNYTGQRCEETRTIVPHVHEVAVSGEGLETWEVAIVAVVTAVILALMLVTSPYILWKNQWLPMKKLIFFFQPFDVDDEKEFDAFVSYMTTPRDERFVLQHLYPKLEKELGFRLCLHFRDFLPGESTASNIKRAIESSRRTILILSPNYVCSEWCRPEYQKVQYELLKVKHKVITIVLEDISGTPEVDSTLKTLTDTANNIKWPGEEKSSTSKQIDTFWQLLELSMPKRKSDCDCSEGSSGIYSSDLPVTDISKTCFNTIVSSLTEEDIRTSSIKRGGSSTTDSGNSSEKTVPFDKPKRSSIGKLRFPERTWAHLGAITTISLTPPTESQRSNSGSDDTGIDMSISSSSSSTSDISVVLKRPTLRYPGTAALSSFETDSVKTNVKAVPFLTSDNHIVEISDAGHGSQGAIYPPTSRRY